MRAEPGDAPDGAKGVGHGYTEEVEQRLLAFEHRYEQAAAPFQWKFTRHDLALLMNKLASQPSYPAAA